MLIFVLIIYALGYLIAFRKLFAYHAEEIEVIHDWEDIFFCSFISFIFAIAWPLVLIGSWISKHDPERFARRIAGETKDAKIERLERELVQRQERIFALERDVLEDSD